ncbi:MAG: serpin family protein, partial [Nitrospinales bacterium]
MKSAPVASATNDFAFKLYEKLSDEKGNVLFSPFSISCVLAMLCVGAERETRDQMKKVLGLPDEDESWKEAYCQFLNLLENSPQEHRCEIQTANALWAQSGYEIIKDYRQLIEARFQSGLYELDFSSDP